MSDQLSAHAKWAGLSDGLYLAKGRCPSTIARHLDDCLGQPEQVLDAGCGTGAVLASWPRDIERCGFDHDPGLVQYAAQRTEPKLRFEIGTFNQPPAGSFQSVLALFAALQYVLDDEARQRAVLALQSRVAHGGALAIELGPDPDTMHPPTATWTRWRAADGQWWLRRAMASTEDQTLVIDFEFHRGGPASPVVHRDTHRIQPVTRRWWIALFPEPSWAVRFDHIPGGGPLLIATRT
jgi:SAM-dependent methyltransferase